MEEQSHERYPTRGGLLQNDSWQAPQVKWEDGGSDMMRLSEAPSIAQGEFYEEAGSSISAFNYKPKHQTEIIVVLSKNEMMGEHLSYHQSITGQEAERRLKMFGQHGYLTRYSQSHKCYVLTVYRKQRPDDAIEHLGIVIKENGKHIIKGREDEEFESIDVLLAYYETHRISPGFPSIGRMYTEVEFERQQDELDQQEDTKEEGKLVDKLIEEFQEAEKHNQRELQAALEQKERELQAADTRRQAELQAAEELRQ